MAFGEAGTHQLATSAFQWEHPPSDALINICTLGWNQHGPL